MKHIIFKSKTGSVKKLGSGFIIPILSALAGMLLPKMVGGSVHDEHGHKIIDHIPKMTRAQIAEGLRECLIDMEAYVGELEEFEELGSSSDEEHGSGKRKRVAKKKTAGARKKTGGYSSSVGRGVFSASGKCGGEGVFGAPGSGVFPGAGIYSTSLDDGISGTGVFSAGSKKKKAGSTTRPPARKSERATFHL